MSETTATPSAATQPLPTLDSPTVDQSALTGEPRPLDLSKFSRPANLAEVRLEEFTIDGICGVY